MKIYLVSLLMFSAVLFASCDSGYGKKVKVSDHTEIFIKNDATEEEAKKLGNYIDSTWKDQTNDKSFQLSKDSGNYTVRMVVDENKVKADTTLDVSFQAIQFLIEDQVFKGSKVTLILTDNKFNDIKTVQSNPSLFTDQPLAPADSVNADK
jgi:hypothetical protein